MSQPILIANTKVGLERDLEPWLIDNDAFPDMTDFFIFRGRILRRSGFRTIGRLDAAQQQTFTPVAPAGPTFNYTNTIVGTPIFPGSIRMFIYDSSVPPVILRTFNDTGLGGLLQAPIPSFTITNITNSNPATVTTSIPHGFVNGQIVVIQNVQGLTIPPPGAGSPVNGRAFVVANAGATTFDLTGLDTTNDSPYITAGGDVSLGGTIDYSTGIFTISVPGLVGTPPFNLLVRFYQNTFPCLPVMGIRTREIFSINQEETIFFDTEKANIFDDTSNAFIDITFHKVTGSAFSWTGTDTNFFWSTNYAGAFWETNFVPGLHPSSVVTNPGEGDGIRWYDGDALFTQGWVNFNPLVDNAGTRLLGCLLIIPYYNRLVVLNTFEGTTLAGQAQFPQRARWCQIGTPYPALSPDGVTNAQKPATFQGNQQDDAWNSKIPGKGGFVDAATSEHIVSCAFYKDQLIVWFERSTWVLLYTGNPILPFIWERIHAEFGCESTFSPTVFDSGVLAVGDKAITIATGTGVQRIDSKIPDEVFKLKNANEGHIRVHGIRDFFRELVYWTVPEFNAPEQDTENSEDDKAFPSRLLVYNYRDKSFSYFKDSFTAFGYFQYTFDITWDQADENWDEADYNWDGEDEQSSFPSIAAGNQAGYVMILNQQDLNDPSQNIIAINNSIPTAVQVTTCAQHTLDDGDFIMITEASDTPQAIVGEDKGKIIGNSFSSVTKNRAVQPGSVTITVGAQVFTDPLTDGVLQPNDGNICYSSGVFTIYFKPQITIETSVLMNYTWTINGGVFKIQPLSTSLDNGTVLQINKWDSTGLPIASMQDAQLTVVNNPFLHTKRFSPAIGSGKQSRFPYVEWYLERTDDGEFTIDVLYDDNPDPLEGGERLIVNTKPENLAVLGGTNQTFQQRIWHRMFTNAQGDFIQFELTLSDAQMICPEIAASPINIHGILIYNQPVGRLV